MVQGSDIIKINKLIYIFTFYCKEDDKESSVSEESIHNVNERPINNNNNNSQISQRNTEIINTDINTSSISFVLNKNI